MAKPSYWELLKHPKWQAKRLAVMQRAGFACEWCDDADTTLHIHHTYYAKGAKPWEYPDDHLLCLCETCHDRAEFLRAEAAKLAGIVASLGETTIETLIGYARALIAADSGDGFVPIGSNHEAFGVSDLLRTDWEKLVELACARSRGGGEYGVYVRDTRRAN